MGKRNADMILAVCLCKDGNELNIQHILNDINTVEIKFLDEVTKSKNIAM